MFVFFFFLKLLRTFFFLHVGIQIKYGIVSKTLVLLLLILILILLSGLYHNGIMFLCPFKNFLGTIYWKIWQQFSHFLFHNGILFLHPFKNFFFGNCYTITIAPIMVAIMVMVETMWW